MVRLAFDDELMSAVAEAIQSALPQHGIDRRESI